MPERKVVVVAPPSAPVAPNPVYDQSQYEYVTIPEKDLFDQPHPGVGINFEHYGPGRHLLDPARAETVKDRLYQFQRMQVRLLQPGRDLKALKVLENTGNTNTVIPA